MEDFDMLQGKIADLTKTAKTPGGISLFTDKTKTTYKSTYQLLKEIASIYHDLTDKQQAGLLEALAGKRGGQVLAGLLDDFSEVEKAMGQISESAGSADAEMEIVEESITFKLNTLKQTWVGFVQDLIDRGTLGTLIDNLTKLSEKFIQLIEAHPAATLVGIGTAFKTLGTILKGSLITKSINSMVSAIERLTNIKRGGLAAAGLFGGASGTFKPLQDAINGFKNATRAAEDTADAITNVGQVSTTASGIIVRDTRAATVGIKATEGAIESTEVAASGLSATLSAILPLLIAIGAVYIGYKAWDELTTTVKEAREELDKTSSKIEDLKSQIQELEDLDYRDVAQQNRLQNLRDELELQEQIYAVEKRRVMQEQYGHKFSDYTDEDNYNAKLVADTNGQNKGSSSQLLIFDKKHQQEIKEATKAVEKYEKALQALMNGDANEYKLAGFTKDRITKLLNDAKADLEKLQNERDETQANIAAKIVDYRADIQAMESDLEFMENDTEGLFTDADITELKKEIALYQNQLDILEKAREGYLRATGKFQYSQEEQFARLIGEHLDIKFDEKGFSNLSNQVTQIQDYIDSLSPDQKTALFELGIDPSSFDGMDAQEAIDYINGLLEEAGPAQVGIDTGIESDIITSVSNINTKLKPQFDELASAYNAIFNGDNGFDLEVVDVDLMEGIRKTFRELGDDIGVSFEDGDRAVNQFLDTITSAETKSKSLLEQQQITQQAFNDLATSYFYSAEGLKDLNDETADAIDQQLEQLGITNSTEIVTQALADAKAVEAAQTALAAGKSYEDVNALLTEANASEYARIAAFQLAVQEQILSNTELNFSDKIKAINDLAGAYLTAANAAKVAAYSAQLESKIKVGDINGDPNQMLNDYIAGLQTSLDVEKLKLNVEWPGGGSSAKGAGSAAGKDFKSGFDEELSKLKDSYDRGEITLAQYLAAYRALIDKYFADTEANAEERAKALHDYLVEMKGYYDSAISGVTTLLDFRIKAAQKQKEKAIKAIEEERDAQINALEDQKKAIQKVIKEKQKQIKAIEKMKKPLQDEIDKIREANEERDRELQLQKDLYALEMAKNQRTNLVWKICQTSQKCDVIKSCYIG